MQISAEDVKQLREKTGSGMMDCKKALQETDGDFDKAVDYLRKKGLASASKRSHREASEGLVTSYIHSNNRVGVLLEINCETDFVAKTDDFKDLAKDICMHIAAINPLAIRREDIPQDIVEKEREIYKDQIKNKPENIIDKIIQGKLDKFFKETCLLEQPFVKDDKISVDERVKQVIAKTGENIVVRRFTRYELGGE